MQVVCIRGRGSDLPGLGGWFMRWASTVGERLRDTIGGFIRGHS